MNMTKPARNLDPALQSMMPVLYLIATASFAANLSVRAIDPVLPHIADDLAVSIAEAAGLSAALAFTFAIVQPIVGAVADLIGKARVMITCLGLLGIGSILGAFADSFPLLLATRVLCGIGAGGVFPVTLSLTSDLVPIAARQIAISRVLAGAMIGNILGSTLGGVVGDLLGWRGVLMLLGVLTTAASIAVGIGLRGGPATASAVGGDFATLKHGYRILFANPRTKICFSVVFVEGCCVFGVFPFVASFLFELGETRLSIAGIVIAGFALGGLLYTASVTRLLPAIGVRGLMIGGGLMLMVAFLARRCSASSLSCSASACRGRRRWRASSSWASASTCCTAACRCSPANCRWKRAPPRWRCIPASSSSARPPGRSFTVSAFPISARCRPWRWRRSR